jgi:hypothetical protein
MRMPILAWIGIRRWIRIGIETMLPVPKEEFRTLFSFAADLFPK